MTCNDESVFRIYIKVLNLEADYNFSKWYTCFLHSIVVLSNQLLFRIINIQSHVAYFASVFFYITSMTFDNLDVQVILYVLTAAIEERVYKLNVTLK